jgi:hypothetical protein
LQPGRDVDLAITPITSLRRGGRPVDTFSVMCDGIVNKILGERVLTIQRNGTATKLVPPLDFFLRARRDDVTGELKAAKELVVKGHYVSLVQDHSNPGQPIFRTDDTAFEYEPSDIEAYQRAMATALSTRAAAGLAVSDEFKSWASQQFL